METKKTATAPKDSRLYREFDIELDGERKAEIDVDKRTVPVAFSSEQPVTRIDWKTWEPYEEVLDHTPRSVRMKRLKSGAPVLVNHNSDDQVGVVESATIDEDRVGRAVLRFSKSQRGEEIFQDIIDGIRKKISFGYMVYKLKAEGEKEEGKNPIKRATDWEPFEISTVPLPADNSVGVGRSLEEEPNQVDNVPKVGASDGQTNERTEQTMGQDGMTTVVTAPTEEANRAERAKIKLAEVSRVREITALGRKFDCEAEAARAIESDIGADEFRKTVLDNLDKPKTVPFKAVVEDSRGGLSAGEMSRYSLFRAINSTIPGTKESAGCFEREVSDTLAKRFGREARGVFVPDEFFRRVLAAQQAAREIATGKRDLTVGTAADGGYTVATNMLGLIELLRNRMMVARLGATMLDGLVGDVAIPRQSGAATAYWVAENGSVTESKQAFQQVTMTPKTVGALTEISRKLLQQSSIGVENFVGMDLTKVLGLGIDLAALHGAGGSEPTGIAGTAGIGSVVGGTNGAAPTWDHIVDLETQVAIDNADLGALAYLSNAKVRGKLKRTTRFTNVDTPIWDDGNEPGLGMVNGYNAFATQQVSSALTKGTAVGICSAIFFGNWADLLIGSWGGLDLLADPYTNSATGALRIVAMQSVDIAVRHPESFAAMLDALTT